MLIEQVKYVAVTKFRILTHGGFVLKSKFNNHTIRLFTSPEAIRLYFGNHKSLKRVKYYIAKANVKIEVEELDYDSECLD